MNRSDHIMSRAIDRWIVMLASRRVFGILCLAVVLVACQGAGPSKVIPLTTLNDSGVTGTVTLTTVDGGHTRVDIEVSAAGHNDMPAHIHPGNCATLVPQPKYPLQSVQLGRSSTVIAASMADLTHGDLAVNLHLSNDDMKTYTACGELK
jgi:hypothetical protein